VSNLVVRRWLEKGAVSREKVAETWRREGYDCRLWIDPPGQEWIDFVHSTDELVVLLEGDLEVEVAGQRAHLQPGDEVFIPAGARHSVFNRGTTTANWLFGYRQR
jgi:mannose-6-phosphate isomerase-like protein (cupin superfamily)